MPGRIRWEDLDRAGRAKVHQLVDRVARPAPARTRSAPEPACSKRVDITGRWFCLSCGLRSDSEAAAARHAAAVRHYRYTDLGLDL
jgi:hypothetical protein